MLPGWLIPFAHFTLRCRQQACERISAGQVAEQSAPHYRDPSWKRCGGAEAEMLRP